MIRALIFDCFGVLYRDNIGILHELATQDKQQALQDIIHACDHGFISRTEYFEKIAELVGKSADDIRDVEAKQFVVNQPLINKIRELKTRYKVGLLSNIGDETMGRLFPEPLRSELFDSFVLSSTVGLTKPTLKLFEYAVNDIGCRPEECVMIDDRQMNIEAARATGMVGLLYTTNREFERDLLELEQVNA